MEKTETVPLFVHGVEKTGTSTLVGILNSHPEVFVLYETMLDNCRISKYGNQLLEEFPEARVLFRKTTNIAEPYLKLAKMIQRKNPGYNYRYIGDKLISLDPARTQPEVPHKTIYTFRDARTWLPKGQIVKYYRTDLDLVAPAVEYLRYIISSFQYRNSMHVRLNDIVFRNQDLLAALSDYLGLSIIEYADQWWQTAGSYPKDDPKRLFKWFIGHHSSKVQPKELDTSVVLQQVPFWEEYLPLFDKYFRTGFFPEFSAEEINQDLISLDGLLAHAPLPLHQAYQKIETDILGPEKSRLDTVKQRLKGYFR